VPRTARKWWWRIATACRNMGWRVRIILVTAEAAKRQRSQAMRLPDPLHRAQRHTASPSPLSARSSASPRLGRSFSLSATTGADPLLVAKAIGLVFWFSRATGQPRLRAGTPLSEPHTEFRDPAPRMRAQPQAQPIRLGRRSRPHHRNDQSWASSDGVRPLALVPTKVWNLLIASDY
jgi:hypothetical protein